MLSLCNTYYKMLSIYNFMPKEKFPKFSDDESDEIILGDDSGEIIEVDPETFKAKEKGKPELDESEFVFHPEDGSVSYKLDKDGCQKGYHWDKNLMRCVPNN